MLRLIAVSAVLTLAVSMNPAAAQVSGSTGATTPSVTPRQVVVPNIQVTQPSLPARPAGPGMGPTYTQPTQPPLGSMQPVQPGGAMQPIQPSGAMQPVQPQMGAQPGMLGAGPGSMMGTPTPGSIAVDSGSLYVVNNNQLSKFDKFNGQLQGSTMLPSMQAQPSAAGAGPAATPGQSGAAVQPIAPEQTPGAVGAGPSVSQVQNLPSVAVDESTIYINRGNQISRFRKDNLQFLGSSYIPTNQVCAQPATIGAGPMYTPACITTTPSVMTGVTVSTGSVCPPYVYTQAGSAIPQVCPPVAIGAGPLTVCPNSMICVAISPAFRAELDNLTGLSSCGLEQAFLRILVQENSGAIAWSQLAQERASQPMLREFACRAIERRCQEDQQLTRYMGTWYGGQTPFVMSAADAQVYNKLQCLSGADFDVTYMQAMLVNDLEVNELAGRVQERIYHPEAGRAVSSARGTAVRESAQLRTWLQDWYHVRVQPGAAIPVL